MDKSLDCDWWDEVWPARIMTNIENLGLPPQTGIVAIPVHNLNDTNNIHNGMHQTNSDEGHRKKSPPQTTYHQSG